MIVFYTFNSFSQIEFIPNQGQFYDFDGKTHPEILYKLESPGCNIYFKADGLMYQFYKFEEKSESEYTKEEKEAKEHGNYGFISKKVFYYQMNVNFINSSSEVSFETGKETEMVRNYYLAHCPDGILNVKATDEITYKEIYPNIDLRFYSLDGKLKYDYILHPGADVKMIKTQYEGFDEMDLNKEGYIEIKNPLTTITDAKPIAFTETQSDIPVNFNFDKKNNTIQFDLEIDEITETIIIDPSIVWGTLFGGSQSATWTRPVFDNNDNMYNSGYTYETTFPVLNAGSGQYFDDTKDGITDLVIMRFNADHSLAWCTYYGGESGDYLAGSTDYGKAIAINSNNEIYIAGNVQSGTTTFPTFNPGGGVWFQNQTKIHGETAFILKFNENGVRLWASMFQHEGAATVSEGIRINGIVCDDTRLYITGQLYNWNGNGIPLRTLGGAYNNSTFVGSQDVFVGRFDTGDALEWCTYLNGANPANASFAQGCDLHVDSQNNLWFVGRETNGAGGPGHHLLNPGGGAYYQAANAGNQDLIFTKFNSSMSIVWSTYYGGAEQDIPSMITCDENDNPLVVLRTIRSADFPTTNPGGGAFFQGTLGAVGNDDAGIIKFNNNAVPLWSTYVGGTGNTSTLTGIGANETGDIYLSGYSNSADFPTMFQAGSYNDNSINGEFDAVFMKFNPSGVMQWSTFYGGSSNEVLYSGKGALNVGNCNTDFAAFGYTNSADIGFVNPGGGAYYQTTGGTGNSFIFYFNDGSNSPSTAATGITGTSTICSGSSTTLTVSGGSLAPGANWQWYSTSCGGTAVGSGTSIVVSPTSNTTYFVRAEGPCGETACVSIAITVNANSVAATSISASVNPICPSANTTLSVVGGTLGTGANWEWYTGSCGGTSVGSGTSLIVNPSTTTTYFVRAEGTCGNTTCQQITINVNSNSVAPTAVNATANPICVGDNTSLSVSGGSLGTGANWEWYSGSCGGTFVGSGASVLVSPASTTTYFVRAEGTCGNTSCESVTITVNNLPTPSITSSSADLCAGATLNLTGSPAGGTFTVNSGPGTITGNDLTANGAGNIQIQYSVTVSGCTGFTTQNINVNANSDASWTSPGTICETSGILDLNSLITGTSGGNWSGTGVSGNNFDPTGLQGQTIPITYNVGTSCPDELTLNIIVESNVSAAWDNPSAICENAASINLTDYITGSTGGSWSGTGVSGSVFNPNGLSGTVDITYTVGSGSCTDNLIHTITILGPPSTPTLTASETTICQGESVTLNGTGSDVGVTYTIYADAGATTVIGEAPQIVNPTTNTTYYLLATAANSCSNVGGVQSLEIIVNPRPSLTTDPYPTSICLGASVTLTANGVGDFSWSTGETTPTITVSPTEQTFYIVTLTNSEGCTNDAQFGISVEENTNITANDDQATTNINTLVNINVSVNDIGATGDLSITQNPLHGIASIQSNGTIDYLPFNNYIGSDSLMYQVCHFVCQTVCDSAMVYITINGENELTVPGGFSPNGDNVNDVFIIEGLEAYPNNELVIYNRWGDIVYSAAPYLNDWEGTSEGNRTISGDYVITGTYFYVLKLDNDTEPLKGSIEIKR